MAWTVPKTFMAENPLTAAELNTYVRDNLLETEAGKATEAGQILRSRGTNDVTMHKAAEQLVSAEVFTSSTTPTTLTGGPSVSVTHNGAMLILFGAQLRVSSGSLTTVQCAPELVGVTGGDADVSRCIAYDQSSIVRYTGHVLHYDMGPGTHTVRMRYWVNNGSSTGSFSRRQLCVVPL